MYRFAKKYWFNDFAAYRNVAHNAEAKARELKSRLDQAITPADTDSESEAVLK